MKLFLLLIFAIYGLAENMETNEETEDEKKNDDGEFNLNIIRLAHPYYYELSLYPMVVYVYNFNSMEEFCVADYTIRRPPINCV
jgi:hypothetical protein